jgi:hypothetical protein
MLAQTSILGTIPGWLTLVSVIALAWTLWKGNAGSAVSVLRDANQVLAGRVRELETTTKKQAGVIGALEQRTNLEPIAASVVEQFVLHEKRAQQRHEAQLLIAEMIAKRLGPEPNGNGG